VDFAAGVSYGVAEVRIFKDKLLVVCLVLVFLDLFVKKVIYSFNQS